MRALWRRKPLCLSGWYLCHHPGSEEGRSNPVDHPPSFDHVQRMITETLPEPVNMTHQGLLKVLSLGEAILFCFSGSFTSPLEGPRILRAVQWCKRTYPYNWPYKWITKGFFHAYNRSCTVSIHRFNLFWSGLVIFALFLHNGTKRVQNSGLRWCSKEGRGTRLLGQEMIRFATHLIGGAAK